MWIRKKFGLTLLLISVGLAGCSLPGAGQVTPTASLPAATASPSPTFTNTPQPSPTPTITFTPTVMPTIQPLAGVVRTATNVRSRPAKGGDRVGGLNYRVQVKVIGRNDQANWYWIIFPDSPTGTGWVTARAIDLAGEIGVLPIVIFPGEDYTHPVALPPIIHTVQGSPLPLKDAPAGAVRAIVAQDLFVRVGPGLGYMTLGVLPKGSVLTLTGRSEDKDWVQIDYPSGLDGYGWVSAKLIEVKDDAGDLPRHNNLATPLASRPDSGQAEGPATVDPALPPSPTPTVAPPTPTPTGPVGIVTNQIHIRTGPASSYQSLGLLDPKATVILTGRTLNGLWYQIEYPSGPGGHAWVAAEYVRFDGDPGQLPYFNNEGNPLQ